MKIKNLLFAAAGLMVLASCNNSNPSEVTSFTAGSEEAKFDQFKKAVTFTDNTSYTGYRLNVYMTSKTGGEEVASYSCLWSIDKDNLVAECTISETKLNAEIGNKPAKETKNEHFYVTQGSIIRQQEDGRYIENDGTVNPSTNLPRINPQKDHFSEITLDLSGNSLEMKGKIDSSKANDLFKSDKLASITDATMEASLYDYILEEVSWNYTIGDIEVSQRLVMFYSAPTITIPNL